MKDTNWSVFQQELDNLINLFAKNRGNWGDPILEEKFDNVEKAILAAAKRLEELHHENNLFQ